MKTKWLDVWKSSWFVKHLFFLEFQENFSTMAKVIQNIKDPFKASYQQKENQLLQFKRTTNDLCL